MSENSLEILFTRHSASCGNAREFSDRGKFHKMTKLQTLNPALSNIGLMQIETALAAENKDGLSFKKFIRDTVDKVYCSDMLRACETAKNLFPDREITVLPFVGEKSKAKLFIHLNYDLENKVQGPVDTVKRLKELKYDTSHFNYNLYVAETKGKIPFPSKNKFFEEIVLKKWFNPESPFYLFKYRTRVRILIVSHGHFLRDMISKHSRATKDFWHKPSVFQQKHCAEPNYKPSEPAIGNVGTFMMTLKKEDLQHKLLPAPINIFETNATYDAEKNNCLGYDHRRFIKPEFGRKSYVTRCGEHIRSIPTLKD